MRFVTSFIFALAFTFIAIPAFAESPLAPPSGADKGVATHLSAGIMAYEKESFKDAETHFREALMLDDKSAEAHFDLGLALHGQKKHKEATEEFKIAKKLAPQNARIIGSPTLNKHISM